MQLRVIVSVKSPSFHVCVCYSAISGCDGLRLYWSI